jgi:hypothetical protein
MKIVVIGGTGPAEALVGAADADPAARYFGAELGERTLLPGSDATRYHDWPGRAGA